jgi:hypothetical protein
MKNLTFQWKKLYFFLIIPFCLACKSQKNINSYEIHDGFYKSTLIDGKKDWVYVDNEPEFLLVYPVNSLNGMFFLDTLNKEILNFPQRQWAVQLDREVFTTNELDIDLITIPFKFRGATSGIPPQLNTNLNANLYIGYRSDWYTLGYKRNEFGAFNRITRHYGMTFGLFSGFGSNSINPWVTNDQINYEYDGIVWSNGFAVSFAFNYLNLGLALGIDQLLDNNSRFWIYNKKPWLGVVLGINLN